MIVEKREYTIDNRGKLTILIVESAGTVAVLRDGIEGLKPGDRFFIEDEYQLCPIGGVENVCFKATTAPQHNPDPAGEYTSIGVETTVGPELVP